MNRNRIGPVRGLSQAAALLGGVAMVLATLGLYGVTSYLTGARTREIAIRLALGARAEQILTMILSQALVTVVIAITLGGAAAAGVGVWIQSEVFGAVGVDVIALGGSALLLTLAMLAASVIPAWRASRLDPNDVLRES
jgi:ABC-type antimicrobial peptide transport system permease subunit